VVHRDANNQHSGQPRLLPLLATLLEALAFRQHGVVSRAQLLELGFSAQRLRTLIANGALHPVHPGVYAVGHTRLSQAGRWMAAVLACGPGALLSHRDAGRLQGLLRGTGSGPIHVSAPGTHRLPGIRCHRRRRVEPEYATLLDGIPVTSWARTMLDLATDMPEARLRDALEQAERQGRDFSQLEALLRDSPGHHGLCRLRPLLARFDDGPPDLRSRAEADLLALIREAGLPEPHTNVVVAGVLVDFHWPRQRLVVEVDGRRWHGLQRDMESDRRKDVRLTLAGQRPVRFTASRIRAEPAAVTGEIATLLALAGGESVT
jgi:very-short-patch-repair endonuclease